MKQLISKVEDWAVHKDLIKASNAPAQMGKVREEVAELEFEVANHVKAGMDNFPELKSELGDVFVTIIILAAQLGLDIEECLGVAYEKISKRKGVTVNGIFIKE